MFYGTHCFQNKVLMLLHKWGFRCIIKKTAFEYMYKDSHIYLVKMSKT